jgi:predicted RND superfamily exporter protein
MVPRSVVSFALLVLLGFMGYSATKQDYKSMIVSALVILFILGADIGALLRNWRGGGG